MEKLASKYWIVLITFLLINTNGFSQNLDSIKVKKFTITTSVLDYASVLFFNATNYNLEIAKSFKNRKSVHVNLGYIKSFAPIVDKGFVNFTIPTSIGTKGYKLQFEGRHYLNKHKLFEPVLVLFWLGLFQYKSIVQDNTGYYIAFQSKYQFTETIREEKIVDYIVEEPFQQTYYKDNKYTVDRNVLGGYFKFGYNAIKKSGFTVDHAIGIGIANTSSTSKNKIGDSNDTDFPYDKSFDSGGLLHFDWAYSFKIGWSF